MTDDDQQRRGVMADKRLQLEMCACGRRYKGTDQPHCASCRPQSQRTGERRRGRMDMTDDQQRSKHEGEHTHDWIKTPTNRHPLLCRVCGRFYREWSQAEVTRLAAQVEVMRAVVEAARVFLETSGMATGRVGHPFWVHRGRLADALARLDSATPGVQMADLNTTIEQRDPTIADALPFDFASNSRSESCAQLVREVKHLTEQLERTRTWAEDEQRQRHEVEDKLVAERSEIARLTNAMTFTPRMGWRVLDKAGQWRESLKAEPKAFYLAHLPLTRSNRCVEWLLDDVAVIPIEYRQANSWILGRLPDWGYISEQEAWSSYMRSVEHRIGELLSAHEHRMRGLKELSDHARQQWIRVQRETPIMGLIPPEKTTP